MKTLFTRIFSRKKVVGKIETIEAIIERDFNEIKSIELRQMFIEKCLIELYNDGHQDLAFRLAEKYSPIKTTS